MVIRTLFQHTGNFFPGDESLPVFDARCRRLDAFKRVFNDRLSSTHCTEKRTGYLQPFMDRCGSQFSTDKPLLEIIRIARRDGLHVSIITEELGQVSNYVSLDNFCGRFQISPTIDIGFQKRPQGRRHLCFRLGNQAHIG
ncbi:MAG: hypothetical protein PVH19_11755 [Planctomycetia bacterium]